MRFSEAGSNAKTKEEKICVFIDYLEECENGDYFIEASRVIMSVSLFFTAVSCNSNGGEEYNDEGSYWYYSYRCVTK